MKMTTGKTFLAACLSASLLSACSHQDTQQVAGGTLNSLSLVNEDSVFVPDSQLLFWGFEGAQVPVDIYQASSPDIQNMVKIADDISGNSYRINDDFDTRHYYYVAPNNGEGRWVAERLLPLQGGHNFRDLGGYQTEDGQYTQWGKLYRSGTMNGLTDADYDYLDDLGIRVICDFRSNEERQHEPTQWQSFTHGAEYLTRDYSMREMMSGDGALNIASIRTKEDAEQMFAGFYRKGPYSYKEQYKQMFAELVAGNAPLAFNCSAGKDRAGMAAALVLTALGVPRDTVITDYALTEKVAFHSQEEIDKAQEQDAPHSGFMQMPEEVRNVFMGSKPMFIEAMFDELEKNHGSTMAYIQKELDVSPSDLARLKSLYLTDKS
ncbi:tyrosine-protein phosphatase [Gilvimarinus xylanilyticus]|uniref:Tyrosine-protein phosphatase n=1 Tax=Gilvimarinus xylanilyticus TaxID=2944139 RepID=A0A9X2KV48_9GAMM|nr:tyrosine-protein phosphatase [Gilvimarinus xylanilyticus]MCP8897705.1 tyrosine-protein phosphatase [Gilvimarinus xylanilyticus]